MAVRQFKTGKLTDAQRVIYLELERVGSFTARTGHQRVAGDILVRKGLAVAGPRRKYEWVFTLAKDLVPKRKTVPNHLRPVIPDSPKSKIKRPPAEYSNCVTGNDLIDKILKPSNSGK